MAQPLFCPTSDQFHPKHQRTKEAEAVHEIRVPSAKHSIKERLRRSIEGQSAGLGQSDRRSLFGPLVLWVKRRS